MIPDEKRQKIRHALDALPQRVKDADSPLRAARQIDDATDAIIGIVFNAIAGDKPRLGAHGHSRASEAYASACAAVARLLREQAGVTDVDRLTGLSHDCVEAVLERFPSTVASGPGYQNIFRAIATRQAAAERQGDAEGMRDLAVLNVIARAMLTPVLEPTLEWLDADAIREALDAGPHAPIRVTPQSEMEAVQIIRGQPYGEGVNRGSGGPAEALEAETKAMAGGVFLTRTPKPVRPGDTLSVKIGDATGAGSAGGSSPTRHIPPVGWTAENFKESGLYRDGYRLHDNGRPQPYTKYGFTPPGVVFPTLTAYIHDSAYQAALAAADHDIARERERLIVEKPAPASGAAQQPAPDEEPISAAPEPVVELATFRFVVTSERVDMAYAHFIDPREVPPGAPVKFRTVRFATPHIFRRGDMVTVTYDADTAECRHVSVDKIDLK